MFNFKREVLLGGVAFFSAFLVAATVLVVNKNQYSNLGFLKTATVSTITVKPKFTPAMIYPAGDTRGTNQSYLSWTTSGATRLTVVCTGAFSYNDVAPLNSSEIGPNGFGPFVWEQLSPHGSSVTCSFIPYDDSTGNKGTQYNVMLNLSGATVSNPKVTSASFSPTTISPGETSKLSWVTSDADGIYATCKGSNGSVVAGINQLKIPLTQMTSFTTSTYEELISYGTSINCSLIPYKESSGGTGSAHSVTLKLNEIPQPSIKIDFVEETSVTGNYNIKNEASGGALVGEDFGLWVYYKNFSSSSHTFCWMSKLLTGGKWSSLGSNYTEGDQNIIIPMKYSSAGVEQVWIKILNKTLSDGTSSNCNMSGLTSDSTEQITIHSATSINGVCGSSNGQSFSSMPSSDLCSTGAASSVSGSGPWTWTCAGSNGGIDASCSATKKASGLQGDFDGDGDVDMSDYNTFVTEFQSNQGNTNSTSSADFDQDKKVSMADYNIFVTNYTGSKN